MVLKDGSRECCLQKHRNVNLRCPGHITELWELVGEVLNLGGKEVDILHHHLHIHALTQNGALFWFPPQPKVAWPCSPQLGFTLPPPNWDSLRKRRKGRKLHDHCARTLGPCSVFWEPWVTETLKYGVGPLGGWEAPPNTPPLLVTWMWTYTRN